MEIGKSISNLFDLVQENTDDLPKVMDLLEKIRLSMDEVKDENLQMYINDFTESWLSEGYLESDFDSFRDELNELVVEMGNEGYFSKSD